MILAQWRKIKTKQRKQGILRDNGEHCIKMKSFTLLQVTEM